MQDSDEDEDTQPFAKLFQRLTGSIAENDTTDRIPKTVPKVKAAPTNNKRQNQNKGPGRSANDAKSEKGLDEREDPSDDEPLVPAPKKTRAAKNTGTSARQNLKRNFDEAADESNREQGLADGEDMCAEDKEIMNRFEPLVSELKEMKPVSSTDESAFSQWAKDCLGMLLK